MGFTTAALVFGSSGILACTSQMAWGLGLVDPISTRSMPTRLFSDHSSADRPHQQHADCATVEVVPPLNRRLNWFERSEQLQQYKENHGDCLVPKQYKANPSLGLWVSKQRQNKRLGKLSDLQVEILDELGFVWDASESRYTQSRLEEAWWDRLDRFKHDLQVGMEGVDKSSWVAAQRREYAAFHAAKESRLTPQMVKAMEALSFCWKPLREQTWNQRFQELIDYKDKFGDCVVPIRFKDNPKLARWVNTQRKNYKRKRDGQPSSLTDDQIGRLNRIGFVWDCWNYEFGKLGIDLNSECL